MYIRTSEGLGERPLEYGLGGEGGCGPHAATKGTLCWFMSKHSGSKTAVYVPAAALGTDPVNLLVWIHGDIIPCGDETKDPCDYVKSTTFPLAKQLADSKLPFVLVAPSMNWKAGQHRHELGSAKKMNAFLEEVRTGLTHAGWKSAPKDFGRLILAGHSRAYAVFDHLAAGVVSDKEEWSKDALATLTDVWLLDTTYGSGKNKDTICNNWVAWAKVKSHVNLFIFYFKNSGTAGVAECIREKAAKTRLSNVFVQGFLNGHCILPRCQMPTLLAASHVPPLLQRLLFYRFS
jgi:hypothetical protein